MIKRVKNIIKRVAYGCRYDSESYIKYLKKLGCKIGERTVIFDPRNVLIDETRPWLIDIGNDVQITYGVTILTHGYDWSVLKGVYGEVLGSSGGVTIGNNVFIGVNTTILKGITIGNNVIIGAGSLVNKNIPDNCVAAGNPVRVICSLEQYHIDRLDKQVDEARELVRKFRKVYKMDPREEHLSEFFWLFCGAGDDLHNLHSSYISKMKLVGNFSISKSILGINAKKYCDIDEFLKAVN